MIKLVVLFTYLSLLKTDHISFFEEQVYSTLNQSF